MAAPRKPKSAGVRTGGKSRATAGGASEPPADAPVVRASVNGGAAPSLEMIRARAYEVFLARADAAGDELSDWLTAEREIIGKFAARS